MELEQINAIERATRYGRAEVFRVGHDRWVHGDVVSTIKKELLILH
jgi:hypothetical protein